VVFHRVIDGFMAQTGDVAFGRLGEPLPGPAPAAPTCPTCPPSSPTRSASSAATVGMARSRDPDSANSQFFIMFAPAPHLDGGYTPVGRVVEGMEVVDAIKRGAGQNGAVTGRPDVMESVTVRE
jgi:cyclophilin family peptidyl-prolyl cis-trans isomerase